MLIFAFSDIHGDIGLLREHLTRKVDLFLCAGDLTRMGREIEDVLEVISGSKKPVLCVPGNNETPEMLPDTINIHGKVVDVQGIRIGGLGGSPGNIGIFTWSEEYARAILEQIGPVDILLTHTPPKGTLSAKSLWGDLGSEAIRKYVEKYKPKYVLCGHVHERAGTRELLGATEVINVGPYGVELRLE